MGRTSPNPPVAACITSSEGKILSRGNTQITGKNHAEREAYLHAADLPSYHQLFVSLEPCTHQGKTPPCRDLVLSQKPQQLQIGWKDPNPLVHSGDWDVYRKEGITVSLDPNLARVSIPFLFGFFQRIRYDRPWVWIKSAVNERGEYSPSEERRAPVSSKESEYYLQILRAKFDAVVVGPKTITVDEPSLDFRISESSFAEKGKPVSLVSDEASSFFSPSKGFLKSLFEISPEKKIFEKHKEDVISYQPYRVFVYGEGQVFSRSFIDKQIRLNEMYGKKLCLFFRICKEGSSVSLEKEISDTDLSLLSDFPVEDFFPSQGDLFLRSLSSKGINTVLLEAGSFLFHFVRNHLTEEDCILTVTGSRQESLWKEGKLFPGWKEGKEAAKFKLNADIWQLNNFVSLKNSI